VIGFQTITLHRGFDLAFALGMMYNTDGWGGELGECEMLIAFENLYQAHFVRSMYCWL